MNIKEYLDILKDLWTPTNASKIRMSISNALEMMGNNLKENIDRQDNVENQFQDVLDETTGKDIINGPEIIAARNGEANLKTRLDKEKNEVTAQLAQKTQITPDDFEGTDGEKIKQAIYKAVEDEVYTVNLTRTYDLTGETIDIEKESFWYEVTIVGGTIVKYDDGFIFESSSNTRKHNSPHFKDTHFYGEMGNETYIFNGDHFIRQNMTKCRFRMISLVETSGHIQTLRLINCETNHHQVDFIKANNGYDIKVIGHRGEESSHATARFMNIVTATQNGVSYIDLQIKDSLFEGYVYTIPFLLGTGYNLQFEGNYFEANFGDVEFISPVGTSLITGSITNNIFNIIRGDTHILFSSYNINLHHLAIEKNTLTTLATKTLVSRSININNLESNVRPSGARLTASNYFTRDSDTLPVTHTNVDGHSRFEFKLHLNKLYDLNSFNDLQYLVNIGFNFSNSTAYKGHLTGIVSIDTHVVDGQVNSQLMMSVLSTRNTSGNPNGFFSNAEEYSIYFKETGTDSISYGVNEATIVIELPKSVYRPASYMNVKNLNRVMQRFSVDYD